MTKRNVLLAWPGGSNTWSTPISTPTDTGMILGLLVTVTGSPTGPALFVVAYSLDGTFYMSSPNYVVPLGAGTYSYTVEVPDAAVSVQVYYQAGGGGTGSTSMSGFFGSLLP